MKTVNELMQKRNEITAEIAAMINNIAADNAVLLFKEILNLRDGVSDDFIDEDHYSCDRLYSKIDGVKNIRFGGYDNDTKSEIVLVKIITPKGELLPKEPFVLDGNRYVVETFASKNYSKEVNY